VLFVQLLFILVKRFIQGWETSNLVCQGKRGIALVFTSNKRLQVFDIEEDEDEESDEAEE